MQDILYEGKSKIVSQGPDDKSLIISYKDSLTAFNGEKKAELPGKGALNAAISNLIFAYLEKNGITTHLIKVIDETSVLVKKTEIIMIEVIIRNVAAGNFSKKYGVEEGAALKHPTFEYSLKSDELGDPLMSDSHITALGIATAGELSQLTGQALRINELLSGLFEKAGIRLVDFKLEFGRCEGKIILCDEISADSCRLWDVQTNKKLDKDRFRRDLGDVLENYREVFERLQPICA
jgi:phosphoribosylaminoimidazole-succinocarboxamide synthase